MSNNILDPKFIYPISSSNIFYNPNNARYILSENPVKRGSVIKIGDTERSIKHSEELSICVFTSANKLRVSKGFMEISSEDGLKQFLSLLGFADRRSFLLATMTKFDTNGTMAKRKLILHHFYEDSIQPPL